MQLTSAKTKLNELYDRAMDLLDDVHSPHDRWAKGREHSRKYHKAMQDGPGRAGFVKSAIECLITYHAELGAAADCWEGEQTPLFVELKEYLEITRQTCSELSARLQNDLRAKNELTEDEVKVVLEWLAAQLWDGGFAFLLLLHCEQ